MDDFKDDQIKAMIQLSSASAKATSHNASQRSTKTNWGTFILHHLVASCGVMARARRALSVANG